MQKYFLRSYSLCSPTYVHLIYNYWWSMVAEVEVDEIAVVRVQREECRHELPLWSSVLRFVL